MRIRKQFYFSCLLFFLLLLSAHPVRAQTNGWKLENNTWYYYDNGAKRTGWLKYKGERYYLSKKTGAMYRGLHKINKNIYYFDKKNGHVLKNRWKKAKGFWYYLDKNGKALVNSWKTSKRLKYRLGPDGRMITGVYKIGSRVYYLNEHDTVEKGVTYPIGCRCTGLLRVQGQWRYFDTNGIMAKSKFLKLNNKTYYFDQNGCRKIGWLTLDNKKYYFKSSGAMAVNETLSIGGKQYKFNKKGHASVIKDFVYDPDGNIKVNINNKLYVMESEFATDKGVADGTISDKELLTATVYCEAGTQGLAGMTATAMVILNRTLAVDQGFPGSVRHVIYQKMQFEVVRNGMLGYRLKNKNVVGYDMARKAVNQAYTMYNAYRLSGKKRNQYLGEVLAIPKRDDFDYLFFMTPEAFKATNLTKKSMAFTYLDQTFFLYWR